MIDAMNIIKSKFQLPSSFTPTYLPTYYLLYLDN